MNTVELQTAVLLVGIVLMALLVLLILARAATESRPPGRDALLLLYLSAVVYASAAMHLLTDQSLLVACIWVLPLVHAMFMLKQGGLGALEHSLVRRGGQTQERKRRRIACRLR
jgi:hypothetical protein